MSDQQQVQVEQAITALADLAQAFAGVDQYTSSRLAATRHDLAQHLEAEKWNSWTARMQAGIRRRHFTTRHKSRKGAVHA